MNIKRISLTALLAACCTTNLVSSVNILLNPIASKYFVLCSYAKVKYSSDKVWCIPKAAYIQKFTADPQKWLSSANSLIVPISVCSTCAKSEDCTTTKINEETMIGQYQNPAGSDFCIIWALSNSDYNNTLS